MQKELLIFLAVVLVLASAIYGLQNSKVIDQEWALTIAALGIVALVFLPRIYEFKEYERAVILKIGKYSRTAGPGWILIFPVFEKFIPVDLRVQTLDTKPNEVQTKDDVRVKVDIVSFIRVTNPKKVVLEVRDLNTAIVKLLQGEIRLIIGKMDLDEVIEETEKVNEHLFAKLKEVEDAWGFVVLRVELEMIELPPTLIVARTRAREAKEYKEKVEIEASARQISLEILDKAASKMSDKTMTYLYLDALKRISEGKSNKLIFPLELSRLANNIADSISPNGKEQAKNYDEILGGLKKAYIDRQKSALEKKE
ncbi:MAG: SPFH domain-containing protein [Candidatus Micrarchaeota archaeon]